MTNYNSEEIVMDDQSTTTVERDAEAQRIIDNIELFDGPEVSL